MNKKLFFAINFLIAVLVLVVLFTRIGWQDVMENVGNARWDFLFVAGGLALFFRLGVFPYLWKKILIYSSLEVSYGDLAKINAASLPLKFLLPFKISEVVRAAGLKIFSRQDFATALGSTVLLRVMILISTLEILFVGAILSNKIATALVDAVGIILMLGAVQVVVSKGKGLNWLSGFIYCFQRINAVQLVKLNLLAILFQGAEILGASFILLSLGIRVGLSEIIYYLGLMMIATSLPVSVQGLGIREGIAVMTLAAIEPSLALSFGVLQSVVYHILPAVVGGLVWLMDWAVKIFYGEMLSGFTRGHEVEEN